MTRAQPDLFDQPDFDGATYDASKDKRRLTSQLGLVRTAMSDGRWHTLSELSAISGGPESSVSARLRDLRKEKFGAYTIERRRRERGLWEYQLTR